MGATKVPRVLLHVVKLRLEISDCCFVLRDGNPVHFSRTHKMLTAYRFVVAAL